MSEEWVGSPSEAWQPGPAFRLARALGGTASALLRLRRGASADEVLTTWAGPFLATLGVEVRLEAPLPAEGQMWVCNHLSWLDPLVCLSLRPSRALAKAEAAGYPLIGAALPALGLRFVARECPLSRAAAVVRLVADLRRGERLLVFPEGTTTTGGGLAPLFEGSLRAAYRLGVSVLPLRLRCDHAHYPWTGDAHLAPHLWMLARQARTTVHLRPGPVLRPGSLASEASWIEAIRTHLA